MKNILLFCFFVLVSSLLLAQPKEYPVIRGTWVTNVASEAMISPEKVRETVQHGKRNGLTDLFVVVWNRGMTMYPSQLVKKYIGIEQDPVYKGFDPIRAFVEEGHRAGLRIHAWFEFGFSYAYKDSSENRWLTQYPSWVGRNQQGGLLKKNGFFWWNALDPEVQQFMTQLVLEVVRKYDIDGIQGDDRLPAMPAEGGYEVSTVKKYKAAHAGKSPPANHKDTSWTQWKANLLSAYGKHLYGAVKKVKKNCWVTWAPSIYPWSKEQYLQDWPAWLKGGYADLILPQVYRYNIDAYEKTLKAIDEQVPVKLKHKLFPGILTSLGDGFRVKPEMLQQMLVLNRKYGYKGEVFFYYETIRESLQPLYIRNGNF